jgi:outer membrane protein
MWSRPCCTPARFCRGDARPVPCAQAQRDFTPELSLADAVDIALCGNPTVQAAWAGIKEEASAVGQAKAAYLPTINAAVSGLSDHTWYPDGGGADSMDKGVKANASLVWRLLDVDRTHSRERTEPLQRQAALG